MNGPEVTLLIVLVTLVVLAALSVLTVAVRCGWIQGSASLKLVPPWQRKVPEPRAVKPAAVPESGPSLRDVVHRTAKDAGAA
jgi:hypothetical protein